MWLKSCTVNTSKVAVALKCAGEHGLFVDSAGVPVFLAPLEAYFTGVRVKLLQWSDRLLGEVRAALPT